MLTAEAPWNETNPEWWKAQVEARGDIAWGWLVNEWAARGDPEEAAQLAREIVHLVGGPGLVYHTRKRREKEIARRILELCR